MTPKLATLKLIALGWNPKSIAEKCGIHFTTVYRVLNDRPSTYKVGVALVDMAKRGRKPPRRARHD